MPIFLNTKHYFNRYFDIKASRASIKNWCDPCHLQESHALLWHAKVGVYSYTLYFIHYDTFNFWLIDCLDISWTIVGIDIGSKFIEGGLKVGTPTQFWRPWSVKDAKEGCSAFVSFERRDIFVMVNLLWHRASVFPIGIVVYSN